MRFKMNNVNKDTSKLISRSILMGKLVKGEGKGVKNRPIPFFNPLSNYINFLKISPHEQIQACAPIQYTQHNEKSLKLHPGCLRSFEQRYYLRSLTYLSCLILQNQWCIERGGEVIPHPL